MTDMIIELGVSSLKEIIYESTKYIINYFNDKNSEQKFLEIIKKMEQNKKNLENELLTYIQNNINNNSILSEEIISKYNTEDLNNTLNKIFSTLKIPETIKSKIPNNIKNYKFIEKLQHFNILILGRSGIGKSTLLNSVLELEGEDSAPTGDGKAVTWGEPHGYISKKKIGLRLWDSQGIDKEKYNISKVVNSVKNLINEASINNDPDKFIHCIWYCISGARFEESETESLIELMQIYDDSTLPIIIVFTEAYNEDEVEDVSNEVKKVLNENKIICNKNINICQVVAKQKVIKCKKNNIIIEKDGIKELMDISLKKISHAVNSACFFSFKNKLKNDNEKEYMTKCNELNKINENRINSIASGNKITNLALLNNQIVINSIKKLFSIKDIPKEVKSSVSHLLKKYQEFILNNFNENIPKFIAKCTSEMITDYKKQINSENKDDDPKNIQDELNQKLMEHILNNQKNDEKQRGGYEDELIIKIQILFQDYIIKKASSYINNIIIERLFKLVVDEYNEQINEYNEVIEKIVKESMDKQSEEVMRSCTFD